MSWNIVGLVSRKVIGSPVRRLVLLTMADRANDDGSGVYFSFETIARACELSRATVKRTIKDFEREGLIVQVGTRECENGVTNDYTVVEKAIEALPELPRDPGQREPGAERTRVKHTHPGQPEPGLQRKPGSQRPPRLPEPIPTSSPNLSGNELWKARLDEATRLAGPALSPISPGAKTYTVLRNLCEPAIGEGCDWERDVLPAIEVIAARKLAAGEMFDNWAYIRKAAIANRDSRVAGLPAPQAPQPLKTNGASNGRHDPRAAERAAWDAVCGPVAGDAAGGPGPPVAMGKA